MNTRPRLSLRNILFADAVTCFGFGALLTLAAGPLAAATEIPRALLFYAGASLFPIASLMVYVGARATRSAPLVTFIAAGNVLWTAASVWLMFGGAIAPNALGLAFIGAQAAAVAVLTALEIREAAPLVRAASAA